MPAKTKALLQSWDQSAQHAWRATHQDQVLVFHVLLDASGSMAAHAAALRAAYNMYLRWLQRHAAPMSLLDVRRFGTVITPSAIQTLGAAQPLTAATYSAQLGGTALYDALGTVVTTAQLPQAQHVLIVLTDGEDTVSEAYTATSVKAVLTTLQQHAGWLCVFLGAHRDAADQARDLGFSPGNCLAFAAEGIPVAFATLTKATAKYLAAPVQARKLLAAGGFFHGAGMGA